MTNIKNTDIKDYRMRNFIKRSILLITLIIFVISCQSNLPKKGTTTKPKTKTTINKQATTKKTPKKTIKKQTTKKKIAAKKTSTTKTKKNLITKKKSKGDNIFQPIIDTSKNFGKSISNATKNFGKNFNNFTKNINFDFKSISSKVGKSFFNIIDAIIDFFKELGVKISRSDAVKWLKSLSKEK